MNAIVTCTAPLLPGIFDHRHQARFHPHRFLQERILVRPGYRRAFRPPGHVARLLRFVGVNQNTSAGRRPGFACVAAVSTARHCRPHLATPFVHSFPYSLTAALATARQSCFSSFVSCDVVMLPRLRVSTCSRMGFGLGTGGFGGFFGSFGWLGPFGSFGSFGSLILIRISPAQSSTRRLRPTPTAPNQPTAPCCHFACGSTRLLRRSWRPSPGLHPARSR